MVEAAAEDFGAEDVAFLTAEFALGGGLQVGGLDFHQQGINEPGFAGGQDAHVRSHPEHGEVGEGLLALDDMGEPQGGVGPADVIADFVGTVLKQFAAGVALVGDDLLDDFFQAGNDIPFAFAQGVLV